MHLLTKINNGLAYRWDLYYTKVMVAYYRRLKMPALICKVRHKEKINVLFLLPELGVWKTEALYKLMLQHPRFNPVLGLTTSLEVNEGKSIVKKYLDLKGYSYVDVDDCAVYKALHTDIVFYQKPYQVIYLPHLRVQNNFNKLFCYVHYGAYTLVEKWAINNYLYHFLWQRYMENESIYNEYSNYLGSYPNNMVVTGTPIFDSLQKPKCNYPNPWKNNNLIKIIYAPHHSVGNMHMDGIAYSTFFDYCDYILEIAEKYQDKISIAFKPHPLLYTNLLSVWGKHQTDLYWEKWTKLANTQIETGEYLGLFMHSNAMIHDCSSFQVEYHFTHNPVLFLEREENAHDNLSQYAEKAYRLHYHGYNKDDIEAFILNLIHFKDDLYQNRLMYYRENLTSPHGKTACENICNAILAEAEYRE